MKNLHKSHRRGSEGQPPPRPQVLRSQNRAFLGTVKFFHIFVSKSCPSCVKRGLRYIKKFRNVFLRAKNSSCAKRYTAFAIVEMWFFKYSGICAGINVQDNRSYRKLCLILSTITAFIKSKLSLTQLQIKYQSLNTGPANTRHTIIT